MTANDPLSVALAQGSLALFVGADLPHSVTGVPARGDLARGLARQHELSGSLSLAEAAQRVGQAGNRFGFTDFIRRALDSAGGSPQPFHRRIVALAQTHRLDPIITAAYDDLLERAFQEAQVSINRVVRGGDVVFIHPDRPTLIKLYGDAGQPDTLVVTERDHTGLLRDRDKEALLDEVRGAFRRKTVLFVGYNLADPDFRFLFDQVAESRFARLAYAVWPDLPEAEARMWRDHGIVILERDPLGILGEASGLTAQPSAGDATVALPANDGALSSSSWDVATIRQLLSDAFSDDELITLCFDHFRPVYENFGSGISKGQRIQHLLAYCERQNQTDDLLRRVEEHNPEQYARHAARLRRASTASTHAPEN